MPMFIPVYIMEDMVESVAQKTIGEFGPRQYGLRIPTGVALKILGRQKKNISVENFVNQLANNNPPWASYREFISGCLTVVDKQPVVYPVGIRETWR